jgi:hypothetical protein
MNNLLTQIRGQVGLVLLHRKNTLHGPLANTADIITTGDISNVFHIQKRRASKVVPTRVTITP